MILDQEQPDILFLQETKIDPFETQQMGGYFAEGGSYPRPGGETVGILTLSRVASNAAFSLASLREPVPSDS